MKKNTWFAIGAIAGIVAVVVITLLILPGKSFRGTIFAPGQISPSYQKYVQAFTSGVISTRSDILVVFADDFLDSTHFTTIDRSKLFSFKPSIPGRVIWVNSRTIEFQPNNDLPPGKTFRTKFRLSQLIKVPDSLSTFEFGFQVSFTECV